MQGESQTYMHLYVVGPYEPNKYRQDIERIIRKHLDKKVGDGEHITLIVNDDERDMIDILNEIIRDYPGIRIKVLELDFKKHRRNAYTKRNRKGVMLSTHVLVLKADAETRTQDFVRAEMENTMKNLLYKTVTLDKVEEEVNDVKEG